jgi:alpha-glucosidase
VPARPFRMQRHMHDMMGVGTRAFFARIRALVDEYDGVVTLGEVSSEEGALDRCADYAGSGLHVAYTLGFMKRAFTPTLFADALAAASRAGDAGLCWAFSNHDVERAVSRWSDGRNDGRFARLLMALQLSLPGTICLYQGEELGLDQATVPEALRQDPYGAAFHPVFAGRDGSRTPMPWTALGPHAGFTRARQPWLPVARSHRRRAVDRQEAEPGSLLNAWRRFLRWRRTQPALLQGATVNVTAAGSVLAFERVAGDRRVVCAFNFSSTPARLPFDDLAALKPLAADGFGGHGGMLDGYGAFFAERRALSKVARKTLLQAADD